MTKAKLVEFVKAHKKEIILAAGAVVLGALGIAIINREGNKVTEEILKPWQAAENERINALDWKVGEVTDIWDHDFGTDLIVNTISLSDLGKVGEECLKIDGVTEDTMVSAIVSLITKNTSET